MHGISNVPIMPAKIAMGHHMFIGSIIKWATFEEIYQVVISFVHQILDNFNSGGDGYIFLE